MSGPGATHGGRPFLSFWQIWNMCFGFLGLQFGFALQNANVSRIFQTLGASVDQIPALWIAAPLTGLLVQPLVGYMSDRTWTWLGRRRPYFLVGAVLASTALFLMPRSPTLWIAAGLLWILDASINISMEPFRAFVGDQLPPAQRPTGYSMQSFFIGVGAIVASMLPYLLERIGVSNHSAAALGGPAVPDTVKYSFYLGAGVLLAAVALTVLTTREYPPETLGSFTDARRCRRPRRPASAGCAATGSVGRGRPAGARRDPHGRPRSAAVPCIRRRVRSGASRSCSTAARIVPESSARSCATSRRCRTRCGGWSRCSSARGSRSLRCGSTRPPPWPQAHFGATDPHTDAYNQGANWVGVLFAAYNGFAALAAIVIPPMARQLGVRLTHLINLWLGAAGLLSFMIVRDPHWLLASMIGVGFAWASILSLPYALLSDSVPPQKMGLYMGIFNFFIVIPQLVAASVLGALLKLVFGGAPIYALAIGGVSFILAGALALRVPESAPRKPA